MNPWRMNGTRKDAPNGIDRCDRRDTYDMGHAGRGLRYLSFPGMAMGHGAAAANSAAWLPIGGNRDCNANSTWRKWVDMIPYIMAGIAGAQGRLAISKPTRIRSRYAVGGRVNQAVNRPRAGQEKFRYQRVAFDLAREIRKSYSPGDRFDSEHDLCRRLKATRNTIRKAINILAAKGLLEKRGRAGNYVADYRNNGWDDRLFCVAMPIRNHMWDQLFLSLSHQGIVSERFALICDFTGINAQNPFAEMLPIAQCVDRLRETLAFRPRTLVLQREEPLGLLDGYGHHFRNLILINSPPPTTGFDHVASVRIDRQACWILAARHAAAAGYRRLAILVPHPVSDTSALRAEIAGVTGGIFPADRQVLLIEHGKGWRDVLLQAAGRSTDGPLAVITAYDWGAKKVKDCLVEHGIAIPGQVGVYGANNTPWSVIENLTSVYGDPDAWAAEVFAADAALDDGETGFVRLVPPTLIERGSTLPAPGFADFNA